MGIFDFLTPKADGFAYDPMRLPAGADPENDPVVGYDELGQKIRRSRFDGIVRQQPIRWALLVTCSVMPCKARGTPSQCHAGRWKASR